MDFPRSVSREKIVEALSCLGLTPESICAVYFRPWSVEVHSFAETEEGYKFPVDEGETPAVNVRHIPVSFDEPV